MRILLVHIEKQYSVNNNDINMVILYEESFTKAFDKVRTPTYFYLQLGISNGILTFMIYFVGNEYFQNRCCYWLFKNLF